MRAHTAIYESLDEALKTLEQLREVLPEERIQLVVPGSEEELRRRVPTTDDMPAVGGPLGGILGGALGVGLAFALPGIGPVLVAGTAMAGLLGAAGGVAGYKLGDALDRASSTGLPVDELHVYEDALARGRAVLVALADDAHEARALEILDDGSAETVDAARKAWWLGLRDAQEAAYEAEGGDFDRDEPEFRAGFEAAQSPRYRGLDASARAEVLERRHPDRASSPAFREGFRRGLEFLAGRSRSTTPSVG